MAVQLRTLTKREREIVGRYALKHGEIAGFVAPIADADGAIGSPLIRLHALARMEKAGTITAAQRDAGERFHALFQRAALDGLRAADMSRVYVEGGHGDHVLPGNEGCRRRVAAAVDALGGHGSIAASVAWHVVGLEWSTRRWSAGRVIGGHVASGVLCAALSILEQHFAGRAPRPA
jgi:hypothetical protein